MNAIENSTYEYKTEKNYYDDLNKSSNNKILFDDKQVRINTLLYIKQVKNTYYKYTNKELFNKELYDTFIQDENFDGGLTAFDDEDDVRIFDKYILEYIKKRNSIITYMQCKNKSIELKTSLHDMKEKRSILFVLDMNEKELFKYCYDFIQESDNVHILQEIIFSFIIKYDGKFVRTCVNKVKNGNVNHPYLILERLLL